MKLWKLLLKNVFHNPNDSASNYFKRDVGNVKKNFDFQVAIEPTT